MDKSSRDPVHCWLVSGKAFQAAAKYLYAGLEETGIDDTDFRILEALLNKGPLPVNTIGPKVYLTPGSISTAVDRLVARGLVSRVESSEDRRVRVVSLTAKGRELIAPMFRKTHSRNLPETGRRGREEHLVCTGLGRNGAGSIQRMNIWREFATDGHNGLKNRCGFNEAWQARTARWFEIGARDAWRLLALLPSSPRALAR
jgi:MarR family transcriptional regulator, 2-MHQ and catechol-resistance regulon repressor